MEEKFNNDSHLPEAFEEQLNRIKEERLEKERKGQMKIMVAVIVFVVLYAICCIAFLIGVLMARVA